MKLICVAKKVVDISVKIYGRFLSCEKKGLLCVWLQKSFDIFNDSKIGFCNYVLCNNKCKRGAAKNKTNSSCALLIDFEKQERGCSSKQTQHNIAGKRKNSLEERETDMGHKKSFLYDFTRREREREILLHLFISSYLAF